jgi:hypothetical protein
VKVGCKGLTGIEQTAVLWKGGDSCDGQFNVRDMEFCIKRAVLLRFENVYLLTCNEEGVVQIPPYFVLFDFCHTLYSHSQ